jgi:L-ascorbate metabolism protein UlaG (beta-lactamase superfamily)
MRTLLRRVGTALLFLVIALCLAPSVVMPFLDRVYHRGPESGHFDGERFFNPGAADDLHHGGPSRFFSRWFSGGDARAVWPSTVPVTPARPAARMNGKEMRVTWIGHATVLVQTAGLNILTDPVWSDVVSPFPPIGPKRVRAPGVRFEDLPRIDLVLISHNHYDHLDLPTLKRLWKRDRPAIVTGLGNDRLLRDQGIKASGFDWGGGLTGSRPCPPSAGCGKWAVRVVRNHHWSSRWGTDRNRALWSAFVVETEAGKIFFAGDTGWGDGRWVEEAAARGPYRLAVIPIGAYEPRDFMKTNHINPEEAVAVFEKLRPTAALGVHWGTFQLTFEGINDPPERLAALRKARGVPETAFRATEVGESFEVP